MESEIEKLKQELNDERLARERAEAFLKEFAANGQHKLISTEAQLKAIRGLLEEERERCRRIQSEASERQKEAVLSQVHAREVAAKAQQEVVEATKRVMQKLSAAVAKEERERSRRTPQTISEFNEKRRKFVVAQRKIIKELALAAASPKEAASKAQEEMDRAAETAMGAIKKLRAADLELEASRQAILAQKELLHRLENDIKELSDEIKVRKRAEKCVMKTLAKVRDEIVEALRQSMFAAQDLDSSVADLEAIRQTLEEKIHLSSSLN